MMFRLAVGLTVSGVLITVGALLQGDHTMTMSWNAFYQILTGFSAAWIWAASPRLHREEITCASRSI